MAKTLYALLVGINEYDRRSRIPWLKGCVNDIYGMQAYLETRVADFDLQIKALTDDQATRQGIIDGFRQHLSQAGEDDVALFYYAGHGAQATAPEPFWPVSPDRMMETIVCYDSRIDSDHWDLADKELAQLIAEVDRSNPHIALVLDCCHSGSGTREADSSVATRRAEPDYRIRSLESFLISPQAAQDMVAQSSTVAGTRSLSPMPIQLPVGRHVVLSACQNIEEAKEYMGGNVPRGAFSYFLQESLNKANGRLSYRDLFKRTNALIRSSISAQSPQIDATHSEDLEQPFLGGAIAPHDPYFTVSHHLDHGWVIDGGVIHGLKAPSGSEKAVLALYPFDAATDQMRDIASAIAQATATEVMPQLSKIDSAAPLETTETYKAVVIAMPLPPLRILLEGDTAGIEALTQAIATAGPGQQPSLYVQAAQPNTADAHGAEYRAIAQNDTYIIASSADSRPLVSTVQGYSPASALQVVKTLEHIARWKTIVELASPSSSQIQGSVELKIYTGTQPNHENAQEITDAQIRLEYQYSQTKQTWTPGRFRIKLHNSSNKTLYCALFYLTERFKVDVIKPDGVASTTRLLPGQEIWLANGAVLNGSIPDVLWNKGTTEIQDILKLIACTDEFDPTLMTLGELGLPGAVEAETTRSLSARGSAGGSLNRLMSRVKTRDIGFADDTPTYDDWIANQVAFTFVRPQLTTPIEPDRPVTIGNSLSVQPHSELQANVRLTTVAQSTRDLGRSVLPPLLQNETEAFQFTQSRASDPGLSTLELSNVSNIEAVTPQQPLRIETDMPLGEDEYVLPVAYDGEFYLPLGYGKTVDGKTQIVIERLAEPVSEGNRSITGSIRIFFQKVAAKKLGEKLSQKVGLTFDYPLLAAAQRQSVAGRPEVVYNRDVEALKEKVAQAKTIAIYVHGIFGDTESMLPSLDTAIATLENNKTPIGQLYDLVLAFDYENLNTTIDQNARLLRSRLEDIGLTAGHNKTLHIIAHSMGGLVSRWFIEQEGGNEIVNHLIMLGTPNNGSPWPQVQAGITTAVTFAINGLSLVAAPLKILEGLLKRIETIDVSLDQMQPGSSFLAELAGGKDPGVPYTLVVGNTSLIPEDESAGLKAKIMRRLGKLVELPFFKQPNDIAVSVKSIVFVPEGRSPAPMQLPTACNHLEYFTNPKGLAALTTAVIGTGITGKSATRPATSTREQTTNNTDSQTASAEPAHPRSTVLSSVEPISPDSVAESVAPQSLETAAPSNSARLWLGAIALAVIGLIAALILTQQNTDEPVPVDPAVESQSE
ncbi:MAG: caspase family protein [Cyanobacteria bacterium J06581_3]